MRCIWPCSSTCESRCRTSTSCTSTSTTNPFLAVRASGDAVRHHAARAARPSRAAAGVQRVPVGAGRLDLRTRSGARCRRHPPLGAHDLPRAARRSCSRRGRDASRPISRSSAASRPKAVGSRDPRGAPVPAFRSRSPPRSIRVDAEILRAAHPPGLIRAAVRPSTSARSTTGRNPNS